MGHKSSGGMKMEKGDRVFLGKELTCTRREMGVGRGPYEIKEMKNEAAVLEINGELRVVPISLLIAS